MKKLIILGSILISVILASLLFLYVWTGREAKQNIEIAQQLYPGSPEEALIYYLEDTNNSTKERTHLAVWTLGQIKSEKALPILKGYYQNDPEGSTCQGNHDQVLCQYELFKAIVSIEEDRSFSHARLK